MFQLNIVNQYWAKAQDLLTIGQNICGASLSDIYLDSRSQASEKAKLQLKLQFDISLSDFEFHSRSQGYRKARPWAIVVL